jgi:hypothetical protein
LTRRAARAEPEDDLPFLPVGQVEARLDRRAWAQAAAQLAGQVGAAQNGIK